MSKNKYFSVGKVLAARGIYGEIKVQTWTDSPEDFLLIQKFFGCWRSAAWNNQQENS